MAKAKAKSSSLVMMSDIAALAGVSESTVSRALAGSSLISEKTRQRVVKIAQRHGYAVNPAARSLRRGLSHTIAVMIPLRHAHNQHFSDAFFADMLANLADAVNARGYDLLLHRVSEGEANWVEQPIQSRRADGAIVIGQSLEHKALDQAAVRGVPFVVWGARLPEQHYVSIGTDNFLGGKLATEHLIQRGRKRIAFLGDRRAPEVGERHRGYLKALADSDIRADRKLQLEIPFGADEALRSLSDLVRSGVSLDGVVAASDTIAMSAIRALTESGLKVPADVGVVGFDDVAMASYTLPPLTTIRQEIAPGAVLLVDKLLAILAGEPAQSQQMKPKLVVRAST
ncbi:MAG: LacI family DNA-binding transcriptional regulator [Hyphomonadaceae bacterium]|nr:LacI family DNA-binding transcriptional regulator [Hyphomonadaceae bacterium]